MAKFQGTLQERRAAVYRMKVDEGEPIAQIVAKLGLSPSTVNNDITHWLRSCDDPEIRVR